jgi:hypothetical protein
MPGSYSFGSEHIARKSNVDADSWPALSAGYPMATAAMASELTNPQKNRLTGTSGDDK